MKHVPESATASFSYCDSLSDSDPIKIYEITPDNTMIDISQDFWQGITKDMLPTAFTYGCGSSWAIADDNSIYIIAANSLLYIHEGSIEVVINDVKSAMGIKEDCRYFSPQLAISDSETIAIFLEDNTCVDFQAEQNRPFVYIYRNEQLNLIQMERIRTIESAAFSPDEQLFVIVRQTPAGEQYKIERDGFKIQDGKPMDFLETIPSSCFSG